MKHAHVPKQSNKDTQTSFNSRLKSKGWHLRFNRGQTQEHAQCTRTRSPAAKILTETIAEPVLREKKMERQWLIC